LLTGLFADVIGIPPMFFAVAVICGLLSLFFSARNLAAPAPLRGA
jgi:hypothetical protein